jgi:DNA-binding NtrC family response regulator
MWNRSKDDQQNDEARSQMLVLHDEQTLASLAASLRHRSVCAKAVLLIADALGLPARDLLTYTSKQFRAALRNVGVKTLGEVVRALSVGEPPGPAVWRRGKPASVDAIASLVLDLRDAGSKLEIVEQAIISRAMSMCAGNQSAAARLLGVERKSLTRRLRKGRSAKRSE